LSQHGPRGSVSLARAIQSAVRQASRPGALLVLSDYFDPGPVLKALLLARSAGHDVFLLQILAREEVEPTIEGDYALVDAETEASVELTLDARALSAYAARLAGLLEELRGWARKNGASYVRVISDEPLEPAIRRLVARGID